MAALEVDFTAVGAGGHILVPHGYHVEYAVAGTFVGTVKIERSKSGGLTWEPVLTFTAAADSHFLLEETDRSTVWIRFRCTAFTSGTIETSLEAVDPDAAGDPSVYTMANLGDGDGEVFKETSSNEHRLRTIKAGTGVTLTNNSEDITIDVDVQSVANVGTGDGDVFRDTVAGVHNLKTIKAGSNITVTNNADDITLAAADPAWGDITGTLADQTDLDTALDAISAAVDELDDEFSPSEVDEGNSGTSDTLDWATSYAKKSTLTGNVTYTFSNPTAGASYVLRLLTGAGSFTVTWPAEVNWSSEQGAPTTTAASKMILINFYYDGTDYWGSYLGGFTP